MNKNNSVFYVLWLSLFFSSEAFCQQSLEFEKQLLIKVSPLALLEPETIVVQGGFEYFFNPIFSVQTELAINGGIIGIQSGRNKNKDFSLWKIKNELKFHTKKHYWALEFFYVDKDFLREDDSYTRLGSDFWYDQARIKFQVYGTGLKFGKEVFKSENILLDSFVGLGIRTRYREVEVLEASQNQDPEFNETIGFFTDRYRFEGWDAVPQVTLGFKIGILTRKH